MKINIASNEIIHFIGIGGIGMSGLAQIMNNMGFKVQGSDLNFGKNTLHSKIFEYNLSVKGDLREASKNFFNYLYLIDKLECKGIAIAPIPDYDLGRTINDRLVRASY